MLEIKDILSGYRKINFYFLFSVLCFVFGFFLIINSIINIPFFKDKFHEKKITFSSKPIIKLVPRFTINEDLSISGFYGSVCTAK